MTEKDLEIWKERYKVIDDFIKEFQSTNSREVLKAVYLRMDISHRIIEPYRLNNEVREDKINEVVSKLHNLADTLSLYNYGYKQDKIDKETMSNYLVGSTALDEIKELMNNQTQEKNLDQVQSKAHDELATNSNTQEDTKKEEQEKKDTQASIRKNK